MVCMPPSQATKYGIPVEKRQYNWMQIPPPPEEQATHLITPKERLEKHIVSPGRRHSDLKTQMFCHSEMAVLVRSNSVPYRVVRVVRGHHLLAATCCNCKVSTIPPTTSVDTCLRSTAVLGQSRPHRLTFLHQSPQYTAADTDPGTLFALLSVSF